MEILEAQPIQEEAKGEDIPFGIRAIERGIEVDGVWIFGVNTPVSSGHPSISETRALCSYSSLNLELEPLKPVYSSSSALLCRTAGRVRR